MNEASLSPELTIEEKRARLARLLKEQVDAARKPFDLIAPEDRERLPDSLDDAYPLTVLQRGLLFHSEYEPESDLYHDIFCYRLQGSLEPVALEEAGRKLAARHPVLRTSFAMTGYSEPLQRVHRSGSIPLDVHDLRGVDEEERERALAEWLEEERQRPFEWSRPPLLRFVLHLLSESSCQLSLSFHHSILDGWSVATLMTELLRLCAAHGGDAVLEPPPAISFREYVALERKALQSEENQRFFVDRLGEGPRSRLPRWRAPDPAPESRAVQTLSVPLPHGIVSGLQDLARVAGAPLKSVLLAAHLRVLSLVCGQNEVTTGLALNGRPEEPDGDRILGLFLSVLPLRIGLPRGSWHDLLKEVLRQELELLPRRWYPLAEIQRHLGGAPLFETAFNFMHFHVYRGREEDTELVVEQTRVFEATNFTLLANFSRAPTDGRLELDLAYDPRELEEEQVRRIGESYRRCLQEMAASPGASLGSVTLLSATDEQLLRAWGGQAREKVAEFCLHRQFEQEARRRPEAVAVVCEHASLTYGELNRRANRVAHALRRHGLAAGMLAGLCVERGIEFLVGLLGILKAGGAYLPLDPAAPRERLAFMQEDSGISVLLTQSADVPASVPVMRLDDEAVFAGESEENPATEGGPEGSAYVIYTSGSTGTPKGVLITHSNVARLFVVTRESFGFDEQDSWTFFHSPAFDFSVWEIWGALLYGGRIEVVPQWVARSPGEVLDLIAERRITILNQTPSAFRQLMQAEQWSETPPSLALRFVIFGGEALDLQTLRPWFGGHGDREPTLVNMYGITETTVHVTHRPLRSEDLALGGSVIGRQLPDLEAWVLDRDFTQVPVGTPGELLVGGGGLARGYVGRPGLTAERFVPNPFSSPGHRLYRTGDLVRYLPSGELEYHGRTDHQVKIRGFRIELGEIEARLYQHPSVLEGVVLARRDDSDDTRLVAYVVVDGEATSQEDLRRFLHRSLPDYMLPAVVVFLEELPLSSNGKVDRRALPAPSAERPELERQYVAPRTPVEQQLTEIWQTVLRIERVGIEDDFFEIGGHSLLAAQLNFRIREVFQVDLPLRTLMEESTIAQVAYEIARHQAEKVADGELDQILAEIEGLSDEEVQARLEGGV